MAQRYCQLLTLLTPANSLGPIEKGANDGQVQYANDIVAALKAFLSSRRPTAVITGKKRKGRKSKEKSISRQADGAAENKVTAVNWGLFEPLRPILEPVSSLLAPLTTGNMMYGLLVGLLVASWFGFGLRGGGNSDLDQWTATIGTPERIAAYEEIWKREESELWEWLDERVGMDRLRDVSAGEEQAVRGRLKDEKLVAREVENAIKVTEEKLRVLKSVVNKEKAKKTKASVESKPPVEEPMEPVELE